MATGNPLAGRFRVRKRGRVLYLALEEPKARTKARIKQIFAGDTASLAAVNFVYLILPLMAGGAEQLDQALTENPSELVVIDTLTKLIQLSDRRYQDIARAEYNEIDTLTQLAHKHGAALLLVHHTRKMAGTEVTQTLMGTTGVSAACDNLWVLDRQVDKRASLKVVGRELEGAAYELRLNSDPLGWTVTAEGEEAGLSDERRSIVELLKAEGPLRGAEVARRLKRNESATRRLLIKLATSAVLGQDSLHRYFVEGFGLESPRGAA